VRVETPFEKYQRENNIEPAEGQAEEKKEKTPEEIANEKREVEVAARQKFEKVSKAFENIVAQMKQRTSANPKLASLFN
jgi:hypothetical protein